MDNQSLVPLPQQPANQQKYQTRQRDFTFDDDRDESPGIPLAHYGWLIKRYKYRISGIVIGCTLAALIVSMRMTPIYESTTTIDVDREAPSNVVGQDSQRSFAPNDSDQFISTQLKLAASDSVLRPVVQKFGLEEKEGQSNSKRRKANPLLAAQAPVELKRLKVVRPPNTYLIQISYRATDPQLAADVANGVARSYVDHSYRLRLDSSALLSVYMEGQLEDLKAKMEKSSIALVGYEKEFGIINPEEKTNILSARLMQLNQEYTNRQSARVSKEAAYNAISSGSLEAALVSSQGESFKKLLENQSDKQAKFADARVHFGTNNPAYKEALAQVQEADRQIDNVRQSIMKRIGIEFREAQANEKMLQDAVIKTKAEFDALNSHSFEYKRLKDAAVADAKLYEELVRKIKEAGINANFQNSAVRIADLARPAVDPVSPNIPLYTIAAFLLSLMIAIGTTFAADAIDNTIRDPEMVVRVLKTDIIGTIPTTSAPPLAHALFGDKSLTAVQEAGGAKSLTKSSRASRGDRSREFQEAFRTLRNSILLSNMDRDLHTILVTSSIPGEGKSTTAAFLAAAGAEQGKRTLLIDGDLRRPSVHRKLGLTASPGLTNVLRGQMTWRDAIKTVPGLPDLHIITAGQATSEAASLISRGLEGILAEAGGEYETIILDSPPMLAFAEPLLMAALADGVVLVTVAGQTNRKAVRSAIGTLAKLQTNLIGIVLNKVSKEVSDSYYYYGYYGKYQHYYHVDSDDASAA